MIYLIKAGNAVKIGYSQYPETRIKALQTGNPEKLEILERKNGGRFDEFHLHRLCKEYRLNGEWFRDCPEVRNIFNSYCEEYEGYILPYSTRELTELIKMPKSTINNCIRNLYEKGLVKKQIIIDENGREKEITRYKL